MQSQTVQDGDRLSLGETRYDARRPIIWSGRVLLYKMVTGSLTQ